MTTRTKQATVLIDPTIVLEDALQARHALRIRIADGDPKATADDLEVAERAVRFAQVRVDHAGEAAQRRQAAAAAKRVQAIRDDLPSVFDTTTIDARRDDLKQALVAYLEACADRQARMSDTWDAVSRIGAPFGLTAESGSGSISDAETGATYRRPMPKHDIEQLIVATWKAAYPRSAPPFQK